MSTTKFTTALKHKRNLKRNSTLLSLCFASLALIALFISPAFFMSKAKASEPIKIGVLLPFSGVYGGLGSDQENNLQLGFDTFGREVNGRPIELIKGDTEGKPAVGLQKARELILKHDVDMLVGIISSAVAGAVRDYVHKAGVPLFITNAGNNLLTGENCSPWILRTSFSNSQVVRGMGPYLYKKGYKTAFLMAFDYAAGHQMMDAFRGSFVEAGGAIVGEEYPPLGETKDFGPYLAKLKVAQPEVSFVFFAGGPAIKFVKEYDAFGLREEIPLAAAGWLTSALYLHRQGDAAEGIYSILNYVPSVDNDENRNFQKAHRARFERVGSEFGVAAYDTARLIIAALQKVDGDVSDRATFVKAARKVSFRGPRGPFRIDALTNNIIQNIYISQIKRDENNNTLQPQVIKVLKKMRDEPNGCNL